MYKLVFDTREQPIGLLSFCMHERGRGMTSKRKKFCLEYAASGNATQAAIKAGYSKKTARSVASELLTKPDIKNELERLSEEYRKQKIMDVSEMQERLTSMLRDETKEEFFTVESTGDGRSKAVKHTKHASFSDKIKAMQLLARMQGKLDNNLLVSLIVPKIGGEDDLEE